MRLALKDLLFDRAGRNEAVDEAVLLLPVTPYSSQGLLVGCWVPVRIKENEAIGANEIETAASSFTTEQKDEFFALWIVEFVNKLLSLVDVHGAVEAKTAIVARATKLVEYVKSLGIIADEDDLVIGVLPDSSEHTVEDLHFARVPWLHVSIPPSGVFGDVVIREEQLTAGEIIGKIQKVRVIA